MTRRAPVVLVTTDNHTLGIQTVANIVYQSTGVVAVLFFLNSHLREYPAQVVERIVGRVVQEAEGFSHPVLVGFHLKELSLNRSLQLATALRKAGGENLHLIAGGTYATASPHSLAGLFDTVVVGGGEGILAVLEAMQAGQRLPAVVESPPSHRFEYPLFSDGWVLDPEGQLVWGRGRLLLHPQYKHRQALEVMLSVGCSYSCSFCEVAFLRQRFRGAYRFQLAEADAAVEWLCSELQARGGADYIYFFDEDFLWKPLDWIERFAKRYAQQVKLPFFIFATPASILRSPEKLELLAAAGLDTVNMGVQSGSERIARDLFGRRETSQEVIVCLQRLTELYRSGRVTSPPMIDFIILNPYEHAKDVLATIELVKQLPVPFEMITHCLSFFRGTPLYERSLQDGVRPPDYRFRYDLHDFMSRVSTNELQIDYSSPERRQWLFLNVLLYGMRGIHQVTGEERLLGSLTLSELEHYLQWAATETPTYQQCVDLASRFPNPMADVLYPWELASLRWGDELPAGKRGVQA